MEGQLLVLQIVFSYIHMIAVAGDVVEGAACDAHLLLCAAAADITGLGQLLLDLYQVLLGPGDVQGVADGLQVLDVIAGLLYELAQGLESPLLFVVFCKIALGVLAGCEMFVQGDGDFLVGVVIESSQFFCAGLQAIAVGVDQFAVDFEFIPALRVLKLPGLQVVFLSVPLQGRLDNMAQIRRLLADTGQCLPGGIVGADHLGDGRKFFPSVIGEMTQGQGGKFLWFRAVVIDGRRERAKTHLFHIVAELPVEMDEHVPREVLRCHPGFQGGQITDLLRHHRADAGKAGIDGL